MIVEPATGTPPPDPAPADGAAPAPSAAPAQSATTVTPTLATARMADGMILRTLHWTPTGEAWAVCEIVHGLGEHGGRYDNVARPFAAAGIDTWAYDHRGNGGSGGSRVFVERWELLHDDLETRLRSLRELHPGMPLVLCGHSLGGLVACGYVLSGRGRVLPDLLVLSAPGLDSTLPAWKRRLAYALTGVLPKLRIANGLPEDGLSRDPAVRARADADPLCSNGSTVRWAAEAFHEQDRLRVLLPTIDAMPVPTYVLHGSADPIVPARATEALEGKGNVTRVVNEGLRHEQHHEPEHEAVIGAALAWIEGQLGRA